MSAPACWERRVLHLRREACRCPFLKLRDTVRWLQFMDFAKLVCSKLMDRGCWADFVDPFSGTAVQPALPTFLDALLPDLRRWRHQSSVTAMQVISSNTRKRIDHVDLVCRLLRLQRCQAGPHKVGAQM